MERYYTDIRLESNRINMEGIPSLYHNCNDVLNIINLIWAYLNGTPFTRKNKTVTFPETYWGLPISFDGTPYHDIVDVINKIIDTILGRTTTKPPTPSSDDALMGDLLIDYKLDTPSKDYMGAIKDIIDNLDTPTSPFPDGTLLTTLEDFYRHIGVPLSNPISIYDVATNKFIQNDSIDSGYVSFQVEGTETKAIILPDTFNSNNLMFQILNPGTGYIAPHFFKSLPSNSRMGTGSSHGLRVKVVSQANRTFAFDNNYGTSFWGVYGYKDNVLDANANPKELKAEAAPEFVDGGIIKTAEQFYKFIGLSTGSKFKVKDVFTNTYIRNNSDSAIIKFQSTNEAIGEIIAENLNSGIIFKITNGAGALVSPFYLRPDIGTTNGNMFSGVGIELEIQIISAANKTFVFKSYVNGYYIGTYGRHENTTLNGSNSIQKELKAEVV